MNKKELKAIKPKTKENYSFLFTLLCVCFVSILILSNISASNTIDIAPYISLSSAELLFPFSYIIGDLIVEIYGFKKAKKVIIMGLAISFIASVFLFITTLLPTGYVEYNTVFGSLSGGIIGITFASLLAYFIGALTNAYIMQKFKNKHKEKRFFLRAIVSTVAGEFFDSLIFIFFCCVFASQFYHWDKLMAFVLTITTIKILVEVIVFPLTKQLLKIIKKKEMN